MAGKGRDAFIFTSGKTMLHATINIITLLIAVARFEFTPVIPILAKMAVSEAKNAERTAYIHHISYNF
jgi:hypothetical protein